MKMTRINPILAAALLIPAMGAAQARQPLGAADQAEVSAAKNRLKRDKAAIKADKPAVKAACQAPGPGCEAAQARLQADRDRLKADRQSLERIYDRLRASDSKQKK